MSLLGHGLGGIPHAHQIEPPLPFVGELFLPLEADGATERILIGQIGDIQRIEPARVWTSLSALSAGESGLPSYPTSLSASAYISRASA